VVSRCPGDHPPPRETVVVGAFFSLPLLAGLLRSSRGRRSPFGGAVFPQWGSLLLLELKVAVLQGGDRNFCVKPSGRRTVSPPFLADEPGAQKLS